ncbi:putative membrane protein [Halopolyspora algeriensis]|uniref:Putative membrane protein n=1 Tax=Halopolyspora algeriensis TaxID=1500506 RepID=A0A368VN77_9ACTN|nr:vitamin K epoxide reductase family protein [Halopolyspora algeriensis]RCW43171.1 putative membrane protein [Halopolyspora algeriensis]TQM56229.1 putative membrane protein [Halopolyspora algeriensis]
MTATDNIDQAATEPAAPTAPFGRGLAWLYVIAGAIGLISSAALAIEKFFSLTDPGYVPSCSLNPIVSCGSVMDSPQAALFGFPNPLIGIAAFPVVVTAGVALLSGFRPPRWFRLGMQVGTTLGVLFVHWLINASLYDIGALCPYCMVVWVVTIATFWYTTLHNLERESRPTGGARSAVLGLVRFHTLGLVLWYLVIVVLILQAFWSYWTTLL